MASRRKVEANQRNALASTGPKTEAGKARSSMNALAHGLTAESPVVPWEEAEAFEAFRVAQIAALAPEGALESILAERVALAAWRLRRVVAVETAMLVDDHADASAWLQRFPENDREVTEATILRKAWRTAADHIGLLSRYEATLERSLFQALHELQRLQAVRGGQVQVLPAALDVTVNAQAVREADPAAV